jgi:hypothetical protein
VSQQLAKYAKLTIVGLAPVWLVITLISVTQASSWWNFMMIPAWLVGLHFRNVAHAWFTMKRDCFQLSDNAAAMLAVNNDTATGVRLVKGQIRRLPPRCLFIAVLAEAGEPVVLCRGWRFFKSTTASEKDPGKFTKPSWQCRTVK